MKAPTILLSLGVASGFLVCCASRQPPITGSPESAKPFSSLPGEGFGSLHQMELSATESLHGGGSVQEMTLQGQPVWVLTRSVARGGSTSEITFFRKTPRGYESFFSMPMTVGEFRANQRG